MELKRPIEQYINYDPFSDDMESGKVECRKIKIVKTKKEHWCSEKDHNIPIGDYARFESAKYDGDFMKWYHCCECIDSYLDQWEK